MDEFTTRILSAAVLAISALALTWWSPTSFALLVITGGALAWMEWRALTRTRHVFHRVFGAFYISGAVMALIWLRRFDVNYIWLLFALVWGADSVAYLVGKEFGKHKIIPRISPGKSWEGLAGGMAASIAVLMVATYYPPLLSVLLGMLFAVVGLVGDLYESALKRRAGVKDSGTLIPGHGGVLDRIDALMPCAYLLALLTSLFPPAMGV